MMLADGKWEQRKAATARKGAGSTESRLALDRDISRHIWAKTRPIPHPKEVPDGRGCEDSIDLK
jgi:hypothetical protein